MNVGIYMKKYCMRCMRLVDKGNVCQHCGEIRPQKKIPHLLLPGTILKERYLIGNALGQGGFGITYIGCDLLLNMRVAIKEYFPNGYVNRNINSSTEITVSNQQQADFLETGKDKFLREARVLAEFHDEEGIVDVRDYFKANNTAYIVMEYLDGITLLQCLKQKRIAPELMIEMVMPVMSSLEKIHMRQVIHRDISPDNIMLMKSGKLKLMDFGAARQVDFNDQKSMSVVLKTGFAPVEQYRPRGQLGPWTDIYALCATIYMCITGEAPDNALERVFSDTVKWPSEMGVPISSAMEDVLKKGMAISWRDRYQCIDELRTAFITAISQTDAEKIKDLHKHGELYETEQEGLVTIVSTVLAEQEGSPSEFQLITDGDADEYMATVVAVDDLEIEKSSEQKNNTSSSIDNSKVLREAIWKKTKTIISADFLRQIPTKMKIGGVVAALVIVIAVMLGIMFGGKEEATEIVTPTRIVMMVDAKSVLEEEGVSGVISSLEITDETYNEKFGAYRAECQVTTSNSTYQVLLIYDRDDNSWNLDPQSHLIQ